MDIYEDTKVELKALWLDKQSRQNAKIIIEKAIGATSVISVRTAHEILEELDRMLLEPEEEKKPQVNRGL